VIRSEGMGSSGGYKDANLFFIVGWGTELHVELFEELGFALRTLDSDNISQDFEFVAAVGDSSFVDFEGGMVGTKTSPFDFACCWRGLRDGSSLAARLASITMSSSVRLRRFLRVARFVRVG